MKADIIIDDTIYVGAVGETIEELKEYVKNKWSLSEYAKTRMQVIIKEQKQCNTIEHH